MKLRLFLSLPLLCGGILSSQSGHAATFILNGGAPIVVPPTQSFSLGRQVTDGVGVFTDLYEFTLGSSITLASSGFQSTRLGQESNLDFISALLYAGTGTGGAQIGSFAHGAEDANGQETESLGATLLAPGSYTILVRGNVTADNPVYNGNVTFATSSVPEPAAWSLMLIGFAGVGAALRSKRSSVAFI